MTTIKGITLPLKVAEGHRTAGDTQTREPRNRLAQRPLAVYEAGEERIVALDFRPLARIYPGL